jgi:predicted nucleic acid-binding protein
VKHLVDTNIVSEIRKSNCNVHVKTWFDSTAGNDLYLSVLTVGEIRHGIERLRHRDPSQAVVFESWLAVLRRDFGQRVLDVTVDVADEWGRLGVPDPIPTVDGLLAATALTFGLTFVTRNVGDLSQTGVQLLNPFEPVN